MPAQGTLGNDKVHLLAAYVYSLSHGAGEKSAQ
jgi:cytochrome c oxidase cbb3-type subunit 3